MGWLVAQREAHLQWQEGPSKICLQHLTDSLLLPLLLVKWVRVPWSSRAWPLKGQGKQGAQPRAGVPCSGPNAPCSSRTKAAEAGASWRQDCQLHKQSCTLQEPSWQLSVGQRAALRGHHYGG